MRSGDTMPLALKKSNLKINPDFLKIRSIPAHSGIWLDVTLHRPRNGAHPLAAQVRAKTGDGRQSRCLQQISRCTSGVLRCRYIALNRACVRVLHGIESRWRHVSPLAGTISNPSSPYPPQVVNCIIRVIYGVCWFRSSHACDTHVQSTEIWMILTE